MRNSLDVTVSDLSGLQYLTDVAGYPLQDVFSTPRVRRTGLTIEKVIDLAHQNRNCFIHEDALIVWRDTPFKNGSHLGLLIDFELSEAYLPDRRLAQDTDQDAEISTWRSALMFHAPAMLHAVQGLHDLPDEIRADCRCLFNLSALHGGSIALLAPLPLDRTSYLDLYDLLFHNALPWPPSKHNQLAATGKLTWRYCEGRLPARVLPGRAVPLLPEDVI